LLVGAIVAALPLPGVEDEQWNLSSPEF
jgi:hypothetical protein